MRGVAALGLALWAGGVSAGGASAQSSADVGFLGWARRWKPLRPVAELLRPPPGAPAAPDLLLAPTPRIGLFWSAGNPAALSWEAADGWTAFAASHSARRGEYRRPLDPENENASGLGALSWTRVGERAAAVGEFEFGRTLRGPSSFANFFRPYRGTPFVLTDTARFDTRELRARLEGGIGVELGDWALGLAAGYESADDRTPESQILRTGRLVGYGATLGAARRFVSGRLVVGAHVRARAGAETRTLFPLAASSRAHLIEGLGEPEQIEVLEAPGVRRRLTASGLAVGMSLTGTIGVLRWVAGGERVRRDERQVATIRAVEGEDPMDRWESDGFGATLAVQRPLGSRLLLTLDARWSALDAEARIPDIEETVLLADWTSLSAGGELRLLPAAADGWTGAVRLRFSRLAWSEVDRLAELDLDLTRTEPGVAAAVGHRFSDRWAASLDYGIAFHDASGRVPEATVQGEAYRRLLSPELALYASSATSMAGGATVRWDVGAGVALWLRGRYGSVAPGSSAAGLPDRPGGSRRAFDLLSGVILH